MLEWKDIDFNGQVATFVLTKSRRATEASLGSNLMAWLTEHRLKTRYVFATSRGNPTGTMLTGR